MSRSLSIFVAAVLAGAGPPAIAQETSGDWKQTVFLYGMGAAIEGDAQLGNLSAPVDLSMSNLFDALEYGGMAAYRLENDTWSFTTDATYMALGWQGEAPAVGARGNLDIDQLTVMATAGWKISPRLEALLTAAYFDLSADLTLRLPNRTLAASRSADWVDPLVGFHYAQPFAGKWTFDLRGDIGGFGVGSDLTWHVMTFVRRQNTDAFSWYVGYRVIAFDYESGQGQSYQRYDLKQHGPGIGVALAF